MARSFTPAEVQALIPSLELLMGQLVAARSEAQRLAKVNAPVDQLQPLAERAQKLLHEILELGGQVKDLERGLVDFPSRRNGEVVLLCWQLGEKRLAWWHAEDAGFGGRQPLEAAPTAPAELLN